MRDEPSKVAMISDGQQRQVSRRLRPLTVMLALGAIIALVAGVTAWRHQDGTHLAQPASLPLVLGGATVAMAAEANPLVPVGPTTYVRGAGVDDLTGPMDAWTIPSGPAPSASVSRLAHAMGLDGDPVRESDGWVAGVPPDSAGSGTSPSPSLRVADGSGQRWSFSSDSGAVSCAVASAGWVTGSGSDSGAGAGSGGSGPAADSTPGSAPASVPSDQGVVSSKLPGNGTITNGVVGPGGGCIESPPPTGVLDGPAAEAKVRTLLAAAGLDGRSMTLHSVATSSSTSVEATPSLDGVPALGLTARFLFGAQGVLQYATGTMGEPRRADRYPLLGTSTVIDRLSRSEVILLVAGLNPMAIASDQAGVVGSGNESMGNQSMGNQSMGNQSMGNQSMGASSGSNGAGAGSATSAGPAGAVTTGSTIIRTGTASAGGTATPDPTSGDAVGPGPTAVPPPSPNYRTGPTVVAPSGPSSIPAGSVPADPGPSTTVPPSGGPPSDVTEPTLVEPSTTVLAGITVTITGAERVLAGAPGTDGALWLVPAYRLTADQNRSWTALAIDESFLAPSSPGKPSVDGVVPQTAVGSLPEPTPSTPTSASGEVSPVQPPFAPAPPAPTGTAGPVTGTAVTSP